MLKAVDCPTTMARAILRDVGKLKEHTGDDYQSLVDKARDSGFAGKVVIGVTFCERGQYVILELTAANWAQVIERASKTPVKNPAVYLLNGDEYHIPA